MSFDIVDFSGTLLAEEDVKECVKKLRAFVLEDDKLSIGRTEDEYLYRFLHCTKFNVALAFKKMQDYRNLMLEHPDWFATVGPLDKRKQIEINDKTDLRICDKNGRNVWVLKLGKIDVRNSSMTEQSQIFDIWLESILDDPKTQATGLSVIVDMNEYSWRLFKWLTPSNIRLAATKIDLCPIKELLIHLVNTSFLFNASIKLIWPLLNERLRNMIKFHFDDWSSLHEYIAPELLPIEYGGTGADIDFEKANQLLFDKNSEIGSRLKYQLVIKD